MLQEHALGETLRIVQAENVDGHLRDIRQARDHRAFEGKMLDRPHLVLAKRTLQRAGSLAGA